MATDPLMTPFTMKSLTLRNRIVSTSHEPAYGENGLPTDRYRAYHVEKAKGGVGLTMIGGSAVVSRGSTPAFGNLQLWKDESVPWLRRLADEVHEHGAAVMIQLTHMGHRTYSTTHDWLPPVSASGVREPAHRTFAKQAPEIPGAPHVVDGWDILSGAKRITGRVLVTPERTVSPDVGGIVASGYITALAEAGVRITVLRRLRSIRRADGGLVVTLGVDGSDWTEDRVVDAVVVEAGTQPVTDVYDELVPGSSNGGQIDLDDLLAGRPQTAVHNPDGTYQLFRIGDAVAGRNVHAAMLDAARLCRQV